MRKSFVITSPNHHHSKSEKQPVVPVKSEKTHNHVQKGDKEQHRLAKQEKMPHGRTEKAPLHGAKQANSSKADKGQVNAKHDRLNNRAKSPVTVSPTDRHKEKLGPGLQKQVSLSPPDYYIDPQVLLGDFVEEEVAFAGRIPNFPLHEDITNRTTILRIIDQGKIHRTLASEITPDNKAVFILNVYNIKIVRKKNQELLMRLSIHQIASVSYIKDDRQHILALKYGDPQSGCHLAVMFCENKTVAEEICALVNQCFQLVYTDATMQYIDGQFAKVLESGGTDTSNSGSSVYESTIFGARPTRRMPPKYAFLSPSTNGSAYSSIYRSLPSRGGAPSSSSDLSSWSAAELLQDYLNKLHKKLSAQELKTFAQLLTTRHTDLTFTEFCDKVLQLFGQKRKNLMSGLWPFIGERDHMNFERYLESKGIATDDDTGYWSMPSSASGLSRPRGEDGPVLVRYMDSLHIEDNSTTKRSLSSHSDPGPGAFPIHNIRFMDNVHFADDPFVTIP